MDPWSIYNALNYTTYIRHSLILLYFIESYVRDRIFSSQTMVSGLATAGPSNTFFSKAGTV